MASDLPFYPVPPSRTITPTLKTTPTTMQAVHARPTRIRRLIRSRVPALSKFWWWWLVYGVIGLAVELATLFFDRAGTLSSFLDGTLGHSKWIWWVLWPAIAVAVAIHLSVGWGNLL